MTQFAMRRATTADVPAIMVLLQSRLEWLRTVKQSDQWADVAEWQPVLKFLIKRGQTWVAHAREYDDPVLGTVTLSRDPDPDFWTEEGERAEPALYLSKLATAADAAGRGIGRFMLDWSVDQADEAGVRVVRLDAWRTSDGLLQYYKGEGWEHVRTVEEPGRRSGALFQHPAGALTKEIPQAEIEKLLREDAAAADDPGRGNLVARFRWSAPWHARAVTRPSLRSGQATRP